jgi:hypothetical protein
MRSLSLAFTGSSEPPRWRRVGRGRAGPSLGTTVTDRAGIGPRGRGRAGREGVQGHPFAAAPVGALRFREAQARAAVERRARRDQVGQHLHPAQGPTRRSASTRRPTCRTRRRSRRTASTSTCGPRPGRRREAAGDGVVLRRRLQRRRRLDAVRRRHQARREGRDRHLAQLPRRRASASCRYPG